ncbi:ABC transporter ATP-binding protein [Paenibacillus harenae]|uniref:ABC-2 type transport system ATP-binding protein n=1 Tax=Paenibacillus harenae TaxID=306543 RepID=A0ABT9UE21_PAEHA|nr:ABC transporter ATP-binding protein [Paenibacillus harenae]MDQ0116469.1 ABC-2 type transport system ATP-binding protein [Paenibacillus harenae]
MAVQYSVIDSAVDISGLTKAYGDYLAVNRLDLTIRKGEIFGLLGPNGAGKTTTILMMLGLTEPSNGTVRVLGLDPARSSLDIKRKVGYMPDDLGFYEDRTATDNLIYTARLNGLSEEIARESAKELLDRVGLSAAGGKKVGTYSRGMRQRLGLADVLIKRPEMIILDEPTLGIDPKGVTELLELITVLSKEEGLTVLLSSHHLQQVQQICDRVGLFVGGKLVACGDIEQLSRSLEQKNAIIVELEVGRKTEQFEQSIGEIEGVNSVRSSVSGMNGSHAAFEVVCDADVTPEIARVAATESELLSLRKRSYHLDDIYRRYFEGGDAHGA